MQNLFQPVIQSDSMGNINLGEAKTPREVGNSLFRNLLKKLNDESPQADDLIFLFQDGTPEQRIRGNHRETGPAKGLLKLRNASLTSLVSFHQQNHLDQEKDAQLLESLKDKSGTINISGLLSKIFPETDQSGKEKMGLVIEPVSIPRLEQFLFQCGLNVEEVKAIVEKSLNGKGELALSKLAPQLFPYLKNDDSESRLLSILTRLDIQPKTDGLDPKMMELNLTGLLKKVPEASSTQIQDQIKQKLAALLRDRGLPPEEIKSFLETLSFKEIKVNSPLILQASSTPLLDRAIVTSGRDWQDSPGKGKILKILQGEQYQTKKTAYGIGNNDHEMLSNLSDLVKGGDKGFKNELLQSLSQGKPFPGQEEMGPVSKGIPENKKGQAGAQEPLGFEINLKKPEADITRIETATPVKQDRNLSAPLPRILDRMIFMARGGIQRSRLMIHPPELGKLDLDISIRHGHLQAHLSAESTVVKELIEANLNQLRQQLSNQGLVVEKFEVMLGLNDQNSAGNRHGMPEGKRHQRSPKGSEIPLVSAARDEEKPYTPITSLNRVDVRA